jgi:hypothetical protein
MYVMDWIHLAQDRDKMGSCVGLDKMLRIYLVPVRLLASQEGLGSIKLVGDFS